MQPALPLHGLDGRPEYTGPFRLEHRYDVPFIARLALREKQVQQSYRPIIGIHKWFARRPGSVFRSLILSEFADSSVADAYWRSNDRPGIVADPFMGGGTTIYESLRVGLSVVGSDINPMSYWLVRQGVEPLDLSQFLDIGDKLWRRLRDRVGALYETTCLSCRNLADVKYFLWVKTCACPGCGESVDLFPGYRVAEAVRHPREVFYCPHCDDLRELDDRARSCPTCHTDLSEGTTSRGKATCRNCQTRFTLTGLLESPPRHRLFAMEYHCHDCYPSVKGRQFKGADVDDLRRVEKAEAELDALESVLDIPDDEIPIGDETNRLHRWGYHQYRQMFNKRQLLALGVLMQHIGEVEDARIRDALATVFSDFLRYQNMLGRYDTYALKCQDIFSVHGFPVGLIACENSVPGIVGVGSGSFIHFIRKFAKAKEYAQSPHEIQQLNGRKTIVPIRGESIEADLRRGKVTGEGRGAWLSSGPSQHLKIPDGVLDGVFTDPPYFDNVQYSELMDFCYVWLRRLLGVNTREFRKHSTRSSVELTGNTTAGRGLEEFTAGLSEVFQRMAVALKPGAPFVFTYHHNDPTAYLPLMIALLDSELACTRVLPAPAEMMASLHIVGTGSSIVDSIFVCRSHPWVIANGGYPGGDEYEIEAFVADDLAKLAASGMKPSKGDAACLRAGHVAAAVMRELLSEGWDRSLALPQRMERGRARLASR